MTFRQFVSRFYVKSGRKYFDKCGGPENTEAAIKRIYARYVARHSK